MARSSDQHPETTPALLRSAGALLSVLGALIALPWLYLAMGRFGGFAWGLFGFELLVLTGAVLTLLVSIQRIKVGGAYPLALLCFAGTLVVASVFAIHVDARSLIGDNHPSIAPWVNRTLLLHLLLIAGLATVAMLDVYRRDRRSWGLALRSAVLLIPVIALVLYARRAGWLTLEDSSGELSSVRMVVLILGGIVLGILASVGGHLFIRSFEIALPEKNDPDRS